MERTNTMRLVGTLRDHRPLIVVALEEEAAAFPPDLPHLLTGPGKVAAAVATSWALSRCEPSVVVNAGTAGALRDDVVGLHEIASVAQHDLDVSALEHITGRRFENVIDLGRTGLRLVTGDEFVNDSAVRAALAREADLVDMEGFAVATAARRFGVRVRLVKFVSDGANESAGMAWPEQARLASEHLARWIADYLDV